MKSSLCLLLVGAAPSGTWGSSIRGVQPAQVKPKLDPTSDRIFRKDYVHDLDPKGQAQIKFHHPYPMVQDTNDYDTDYPKDENNDDGEWKAQMEYDLLRTKVAKEKDDYERAKAAEEATAKELEEARKAEEAAEKASQDLGLHKDRYVSELESERVIMTRQAKSEVDEANRAQTEAEEKVRRLEQRVKALQDDHEEASGHHTREKENLRNQHTEMRAKHAEQEEMHTNLRAEVEKHKKDLDEAKKEAERLIMSHKQEQERFQQALEDQLHRAMGRLHSLMVALVANV